MKPDFLTCGDYKSAAEIFMREGPSKEAEAMQNWLLDGLYDTQVARVAAGRKVSPELVKAWIDSGPHSREGQGTGRPSEYARGTTVRASRLEHRKARL